MILRNNEVILHTVYHHFIPYLSRLFYFSFLSVLFYLPVYYFYNLTVFLFVTIILILAFLYMSFIYWKDKLIVTNQRLIFINWISLTKVIETEIQLKDIQDISSFEKGVLRYFPLLCNGKIVIKSSAYNTDISFEEIGKPSKVKTFISKISEK